MTCSPETGLTRRQWIGISGAAATSVLVFPFQAAAKEASHEFHQHPSTRKGFYANSYLIEGDDQCALIDAHLNGDEAQDLARLINATGKPLTTIVITHPHPDHYLGLEHLGPLFSAAAVRSSEATLEIIRTTAADWREFPNVLKPLKQGSLMLANRPFELLLLPDAESIAPVVLFDAETRTLIAGDHVLNGQHLWMVEGRMEAWRNNLALLADLSPRTVLPGHGKIGGPELIESTDGYLRDFLSMKAQNLTAALIKQEMLARYPDHLFTEALDSSILAN